MLNYNDWLSQKTIDDVRWLIKEFGTLTKAYNEYIRESYSENILGDNRGI